MTAARSWKTVVDGYIAGVSSGAIVAGSLVRAAVSRHLADLKRDDIRFDEPAAVRALEFSRFCRHSKGKWAGKVLDLAPWQAFVVWSVFGWMRRGDDGRWVRRFRLAYIEVARKNGKSTFASYLGGYLFAGDGEPGAEVYAAATKRDQAKIVWGEAKRMVRKSPDLSARITAYRSSLICAETDSTFEPLGRDSENLDGLNPHGAIIDEYHAHPDSGIYDVLTTGTGSRLNPLIITITTAGSDAESPCGRLHDYCDSILRNVVQDDSQFAFVASLDEADDWEDEAVWQKSNPNLGVSVFASDLRGQALTAKQFPAARNAFLRLRLNRWTRTTTLAIPMEDWNACSDTVNPEALVGRACYGGLDLSKSGDLTAFVLVFPPTGEDKLWRVMPWLWLPENTVEKKEGTDRVLYRHWIEQGLIHVTDGDVTDYDIVRAVVCEQSKKYQAAQVAFDPWNALQLSLQLQADGVNMLEFPQNMRNFNEPTKKLLELVQSHSLAHGGHAALKWMASNLETKADPSGNIRPVKPDAAKATKRIDGIVALIMAIGAAIKQQTTTSVYETRGLLVI